MADQPTSTAQPFRILPLGDAAVTVEFGNNIDPEVNARVVAFAETIQAQDWDGVLDIVPTYRSVTIHIDSLHIDIPTLSDRLLRLPPAGARQAPSPGTPYTTPCCTEASGVRT